MSNSLTLKFSNNTTIADKDVFIYIQASAANCDVNYDGGSITFGGANVLSNPVSLAVIKKDGLRINKLISGVIYIVYGEQLPSKAIAPNIMTSNVPFAIFEITRNNPPIAGDAGDLTAINYFTAALSVKTYDDKQKVLQSKTYNKTSKDILHKFHKVVPNAIAFNKIKPTQPLRVISGYTYATEAKKNPYPSFDKYLEAVRKDEQSTTIDNNSTAAWNYPATFNWQLYKFCLWV